MRNHLRHSEFVKLTHVHELKGFEGAIETVHVRVVCPELKQQVDFEPEAIVAMAA